MLIGLPGLERRIACYAQFYSRLESAYELSPLSKAEVWRLLQEHSVSASGHVPSEQSWERKLITAIVGALGGNLRLLRRLLAQVERILESN